MESRLSLEIQLGGVGRRCDPKAIVPTHTLVCETVADSNQATANPRKACREANTLPGTPTIGGGDDHPMDLRHVTGKRDGVPPGNQRGCVQLGKIPTQAKDTDQSSGSDLGLLGLIPPLDEIGSLRRLECNGLENSRKESSMVQSFDWHVGSRIGEASHPGPPEPLRGARGDEPDVQISSGEAVPMGLEIGGGGGPWYLEHYPRGPAHEWSGTEKQDRSGRIPDVNVRPRVLPLAPNPAPQEVLSNFGEPPRLKRSGPGSLLLGKGAANAVAGRGKGGRVSNGKDKGKGVAPPMTDIAKTHVGKGKGRTAAEAAPEPGGPQLEPDMSGTEGKYNAQARSTGKRGTGTRASKKANAVNGALVSALQQAAGELDAVREIAQGSGGKESEPAPRDDSREKELEKKRLAEENQEVADRTYLNAMNLIPRRRRNRPHGPSPVPDGYAPDGIGPPTLTGYLPGNMPVGQIFVRYRQLSYADQDTVRASYESRYPRGGEWLTEMLTSAISIGTAMSLFGLSEFLYGKWLTQAAMPKLHTVGGPGGLQLGSPYRSICMGGRSISGSLPSGAQIKETFEDALEWATQLGMLGQTAKSWAGWARGMRTCRKIGRVIGDYRWVCVGAVFGAGLMLLHNGVIRTPISPNALVRITYHPGKPEILADDLRPQNHRTSKLDADGWHTAVERVFSLWNSNIPDSFPVSTLAGVNEGLSGWWREILSKLGLCFCPMVEGRLRTLDTSTTLSAMVFQHMSVSGDNDTAIRNHFASLFYTTNVNLDPFSTVHRDTREYLLALTSNLNGVGQYVRYHQGFATVYPPIAHTGNK